MSPPPASGKRRQTAEHPHEACSHVASLKVRVAGAHRAAKLARSRLQPTSNGTAGGSGIGPQFAGELVTCASVKEALPSAAAGTRGTYSCFGNWKESRKN